MNIDLHNKWKPFERLKQNQLKRWGNTFTLSTSYFLLQGKEDIKKKKSKYSAVCKNEVAELC